MNLKYFIKLYGIKNRLIINLNDLCFLITFTLIRIIHSTYIAYLVWPMLFNYSLDGNRNLIFRF